MGSSGRLSGKLVIAQDAAQSLADLCMQSFCIVAGGFLRGKDIAMSKLDFFN